MASHDRDSIRVFLAEEQGIFRESFSFGLRNDRRIELTGTASAVDPATLMEHAAACAPDVFVIGTRETDHALPGWVKALRTEWPAMGLVLLVGLSAAGILSELTASLSSTTRGYALLLRDNIGSAQDLVHTVHAVADGRVVIDPVLLESVLAPTSSQPKLPRLSERETEVLQLMAAGYRNKAIALELCITTKTVERHIQSIYSKLGTPPDAIQPRAHAIAAFQGLSATPAAMPA